MNIEKLPSGSYRIKKMYKGKKYSVTLDYKPTQKEIVEILADMMNEDITSKSNAPRTLFTAHTEYLSLKSNILSPSTIRGYKSCFNALPQWLLKKNINDIDNLDIQRFINDYTADHSPKSVKNMYGYISIILKTFRPNIKLNVKLPQPEKKEPYIPTSEEVSKIIEEIKNTEYYVATALACLGMRKSEICALTVNDLADDNSITINKALVAGADGKYVIKPVPKTKESTRTIYIPSDVADRIRLQGYVYKGFPDNISRNLARVQEKLGITHFSMHKLRHFFSSYAHDQGLTDAQIMAAGGWKSDVMKRTYRHTMREEESKKQIAKSIGNLF